MSTDSEGRWSEDYLAWRSGENCPYCEEGRPDEIKIGSRFLSTRYTDGYLLNGEAAFGSALLIWRGRHVADPTEMTDEESQAYWRDLMTVARAVEQRYSPLKLNFFTHGNHIPHLHSVVLLRFLEGDPKPGHTILWSQGSSPRDRETMRRETDALRKLISDAAVEETVPR